MKSIIVIADNQITEFKTIEVARSYAKVTSGVIYRREDWYQLVMVLIRELLK